MIRLSVVAGAVALSTLTAPSPSFGDDDPILGPPPLGGTQDVMVRKDGQNTWTGEGEVGVKQQVKVYLLNRGASRTVYFRVCNRDEQQRVRITATGPGQRFNVRYYLAGQDVTAKLAGGDFRPVVKAYTCAPRIKAVITRRKTTPAGYERVFSVVAVPRTGGTDRASARVYSRVPTPAT